MLAEVAERLEALEREVEELYEKMRRLGQMRRLRQAVRPEDVAAEEGKAKENVGEEWFGIAN